MTMIVLCEKINDYSGRLKIPKKKSMEINEQQYFFKSQ